MQTMHATHYSNVHGMLFDSGILYNGNHNDDYANDPDKMMTVSYHNNDVYNQDPVMPMEENNYKDHPSNVIDSYADNHQMWMNMHPPTEEMNAGGRNHLPVSSSIKKDGRLQNDDWSILITDLLFSKEMKYHTIAQNNRC